MANLNFEDKIFGQEEKFESKDAYGRFIDEKIDDVTEVLEKLEKIENRHWDYFGNNEMKDEFDDKLEELIDELKAAISDLESSKSELRG